MGFNQYGQQFEERGRQTSKAQSQLEKPSLKSSGDSGEEGERRNISEG